MPEVFINGAAVEYCWLRCNNEHNAGFYSDHRAIIRIGANGYDVSGNITLNAYDFSQMIPVGSLGSRL